MLIETIYSIISRQHPGVTMADIVQFHNDMIDDGEDHLKYPDFEYLKIISGKRFYKLEKSEVTNVKQLRMQNVNSTYIGITRLTGETDIGDIT